MTIAKRTLILCLAGALLVAGVAVAKPKLLVLGASSTPGAPACPGDPCQVVGKVTGFQTALGSAQKKPFVSPSDGKIVAWSIKLSAPTKTQISFFNNFFGGTPDRSDLDLDRSSSRSRFSTSCSPRARSSISTRITGRPRRSRCSAR